MAVLPYVAALSIQTNGWRETWMLMGGLVWAVALLPVICFVIQTPEDVMLVPDNDVGDDAINSTEDVPLDIPDWTLGQAVRTRSLWLFAISTGIMFLIQSGINVHQAAYFMDQELSITVSALAVSITGVSAGGSSLVWGWLADRFSCRWVFVAVAITMAVSVGLFPLIHGPQEAMVYSAVFGLSVGGILVVPPVVYADYYGRTCLGVIRGVTEPFIGAGQAIGPILSGYIFDITDSYILAFQCFIVIALVSAAFIVVSGDPLENTPSRESK
jgi:MFS family permease